MKTLDSIWRKHTREQDFLAMVPPPAPVLSATPPPTRDPIHPTPSAQRDMRFIARQAIFDRNKKVFAYELLARSGWENHFVGDSDAATRKMISDAALYGFEGLTRGQRAFINCTRESLVQGLVTLLPKRTVLEILETITPDPTVIDACRNIKAEGYEIALDDFRIVPGIEGFIELADYVKVDFRLSGRQERSEILSMFKGSATVLVAEKVETEEEYKIAVGEGFTLFQGYFFCRPTVFTARSTPSNGNHYFQMFSALSQKNVNFAQMATLVKSEVAVCYQLLRLVNSAAVGLSQPVQSVERALMMVGEEQFRKMVLNAIALESCSRHPDELLIRVLQRARFLELISPYTHQNPNEQYMFGLLSLMDVMLDTPMRDLLSTLPLRQEVTDALSGKSNAVSTALTLLEYYEAGQWTQCFEVCSALHIKETQLTSIYSESLQWAELAAAPQSQRAS